MAVRGLIAVVHCAFCLADSPVPAFDSNLPVVVIDTHAVAIPEGDMTMCVPPKPPFVGNDTVALTLSFAESFSATSSFDPSHRRRAYIIQDAGRTTPRSPRAACNHGASQAARSLIKVPQPAVRVLAQARVQGSHTTFRFRASCGPQQRERSCCPLHAVSDRRCCPLHAVSVNLYLPGGVLPICTRIVCWGMVGRAGRPPRSEQLGALRAIHRHHLHARRYDLQPLACHGHVGATHAVHRALCGRGRRASAGRSV
jgi:hypothetical protein